MDVVNRVGQEKIGLRIGKWLKQTAAATVLTDEAKQDRSRMSDRLVKIADFSVIPALKSRW